MSHLDASVVRQKFLRDVEAHTLKVELDNGVHRSLKFSNGNSSIQYYRLNTWPGHLCFSGDMGTFVFARNHDMFQFFRTDDLGVNPHYWHEKLQAVCDTDGSKVYDPKIVADWVFEQVDEGYIDREEHADILEEFDPEGPESEYEAVDLVYQMVDDLEGIQLRRFTYRYLWCLFAIVWGIEQYDNLKQEARKAA